MHCHSRQIPQSLDPLPSIAQLYADHGEMVFNLALNHLQQREETEDQKIGRSENDGLGARGTWLERANLPLIA